MPLWSWRRLAIWAALRARGPAGGRPRPRARVGAAPPVSVGPAPVQDCEWPADAPGAHAGSPAQGRRPPARTARSSHRLQACPAGLRDRVACGRPGTRRSAPARRPRTSRHPRPVAIRPGRAAGSAAISSVSAAGTPGSADRSTMTRVAPAPTTASSSTTRRRAPSVPSRPRWETSAEPSSRRTTVSRSAAFAGSAPRSISVCRDPRPREKGPSPVPEAMPVRNRRGTPAAARSGPPRAGASHS
jgi:hypothetical protein